MQENKILNVQHTGALDHPDIWENVLHLASRDCASEAKQHETCVHARRNNLLENAVQGRRQRPLLSG